jgi:ABC-type Mn2+/Zn2+ transport system ATPase subunit
VSVDLGRSSVLRGVSFDLRKGEVLGLVGPNGGGKTTPIRTLLGIVRPKAGRVLRHVDGIRYGYVPQRETLDAVWPLTALEVVLMARYPRIGLVKRPRHEDRRLAREALDTVEAGDLGDRPYRDLSGGQMRRVLLARALATEPDVLLLDEPTFGMDLSASSGMLSLVERLNREQGLTVLLATHLLDDVANFAERVAFLLAGSLRIGGVGEMLTPSSLTDLYGVPVAVDTANGRRFIWVGPPAD